MANRVGTEDIVKMNELYKKLGTYAAVAREVGFSASTVKKYIKPDFVPKEEIIIRHFEGPLPEINEEYLSNIRKDINELCTLSDEELEEIKEFWKELEI